MAPQLLVMPMVVIRIESWKLYLVGVHSSPIDSTEGSRRAKQGEREMSSITTVRPPLPPFTLETAIEKVRLAEDGWNTRDAVKVALAYSKPKPQLGFVAHRLHLFTSVKTSGEYHFAVSLRRMGVSVCGALCCVTSGASRQVRHDRDGRPALEIARSITGQRDEGASLHA
jgi:Protein of unknown function (DUF1348)